MARLEGPEDAPVAARETYMEGERDAPPVKSPGMAT
jgi:hypothetical protein